MNKLACALPLLLAALPALAQTPPPVPPHPNGRAHQILQMQFDSRQHEPASPPMSGNEATAIQRRAVHHGTDSGGGGNNGGIAAPAAASSGAVSGQSP